MILSRGHAWWRANGYVKRGLYFQLGDSEVRHSKCIPYQRNIITILFCAGLFFAPPALAWCTLPVTFVAQDVKMDMGNVVILPSLPVGAVIKQLVVPIQGTGYVGWCDWTGGSAVGEYVNAKQKVNVAGFANVYQTAVPGIGIRLYRDSGRIQTYYPHILQLGGRRKIELVPGTFKIELVKTAVQTGSGKIGPNGRFTTYYLNGGGPPFLTSSFSGFGTTIISPTCEVQAGRRNISVDFGNVPNSSFSGVGSKAINRDFDINLSCQGGSEAAYQSRISVRLDGEQDGSNMPGMLKLSAVDNSATRIGIQIVRREGSAEHEVRFGQDINIGTTSVASSVLTLPLRARYVQTQAGAVGGGAANGTATFTIKYN